MLGMRLVTYQTGPEGQVVERVLVEQGLQIKRELYLGIVLDRATETAGADGRARTAASRSRRSPTRRPSGSSRSSSIPAPAWPRSRRASSRSRSASKGAQVGQAGKLMIAVYDAFTATDASLIEINPLIVTEDGNLLALDAKMNFDDNALYRHPDIKELRDIGRGRAARGRGVEVLAELHQARRHHRLHGQRRRPRDGDDGHHQAGGRRAGELPRRRRRRQRRADPQRLQDPDVGQERQGGAHQHLRRHPALRHARRGRDRRGQGARRAACRS